VGVGDIGAVQGGARDSGDAANNCDDGRGAIWEHERAMVSGRWLGQHDASGKQGGDGIGGSDSARVEPWACGVHGDGAVRTDEMRGDKVGVGDIGAMPCGAWGSGDATCGDDGRGAVRERDGGIFSGRWLSGNKRVL